MQAAVLIGLSCLCGLLSVVALTALVVLIRRQNQTFDVDDEIPPKTTPKPSAKPEPRVEPRPSVRPPPPVVVRNDEAATVSKHGGSGFGPVPVAPLPPPPPKPGGTLPRPGDLPDPGFVKVPQRSSGQTIIAFDDDLDDDDK